MEYYAILTEAGLATIANAPVTGLPLRFEKFAVGDGGGEEYAPQASQTALKNTCWEGAVASVRADAENPNIVEVRAVLPSTAGGFVVRELGLLNENGVLVAVANCPPTSKVLLSDGVTSEMEVGMQIAVSGTDHISLTVDPTVILVTQKVLDNAMKSHNADPDVHSGLMEEHNADPDAHSGLMEEHNADPEAHGGGMVVTLTHAKSGTTHAFTGLGAREGLVPCQFKSTAGYTEGDTATIDGTPYTIVLTGADQPETDLFVSGKSILVDVDTESKTINFKAGGGLTKAKLALADATEATVFNGKTFYAGDTKELRTGTALSTPITATTDDVNPGVTYYDENGVLKTGTRKKDLMTQIYISDDTFVVPTGVTEVDVMVFGAGASGSLGGAGGGGGHMSHKSVNVTPGESIPITIGQGGSGAGGLSSFGKYLSANGGSGSSGGSGGGGGNGNSGGNASYGGGGGGGGSNNMRYAGSGGNGGTYGGGGGGGGGYIYSNVGSASSGSGGTKGTNGGKGGSGGSSGSGSAGSAGINTQNMDLEFTGTGAKGAGGRAGTNSSYDNIVGGGGGGGGGGYGGKGGNGASGYCYVTSSGQVVGVYGCGGGGGGGYGAAAGNANGVYGGGGGGYGGKGGNASGCGGGGGGYGANGNGGSGNNSAGGIAAGGSGGGHGGHGIIIVKYLE